MIGSRMGMLWAKYVKKDTSTTQTLRNSYDCDKEMIEDTRVYVVNHPYNESLAYRLIYTD
jgi:hypothetical protein